MGESLLEALAAFGLSEHGQIPPSVRSNIAQRVLDITGLQAAALPLATSKAVAAFVEANSQVGTTHMIGRREPTNVAWAAFGNGVLAHSLDYDDTHLPSILHPSASVVPTALAVGEHTSATGQAVIDAIAVGLETTVRLGMAGYDRASGNSLFFEHGQHATSICGTVGAAHSASLLLGLDEAKTIDAMAISVSMASGVIEANRNGGTVKRIHCGWAAHSAVSAAMLAMHGITGPPTALEGRFGFFQAFLHGRFDPDEVTDGLGDRWSIEDIFFKPYPSNHFTHAGIDAARRLRERGLRPEHVKAARLGVASPTVRTIGEPLERKQAPADGYQAQFSGPYTVAASLIGGGGLGLALDDFSDDAAHEPIRCELMKRIDVYGDERCDEIYPDQFPAILTVETFDGDEFVEEVLNNRGGNKDPLSDDELARKYHDNAARTMRRGDADEVRCLVRDLATSNDVGELMTTVAAATAERGGA